MMTAWDRVFSWFPLLMTVLSFAALGVFAQWPTIWAAMLVLFVIYFLPPIVQRIVFRWAALKAGVAKIDGRTFSPWLASHHIQAIYDALPFLESLLRVFPGFYSMWLRMWGSHIGYGVEWPVRMDVLDRSMMDIGNRVVFAREVELAAHVRKKTDGGGSRVLVRGVRIGSYAFIGAGARLGPGANVPSNANVPALAVVDVNESFGDAKRHPEPAEAEFALS
jgi:acetyltransferase-like isoleucine patch superfamily enzyme